MTYPPFVKSAVGIYIETLLRWRGLCKRVGDIGAVYEEILGGTDSIEHPRAGLVDTVGVSLVEYDGLAGAWGAIADATCLFTKVKSLDVVCPHCVEDCSIIADEGGRSEQALGVVLVQL
jgi:hypothetical protein